MSTKKIIVRRVEGSLGGRRCLTHYVQRIDSSYSFLPHTTMLQERPTPTDPTYHLQECLGYYVIFSPTEDVLLVSKDQEDSRSQLLHISMEKARSLALKLQGFEVLDLTKPDH